MADDLIQRPYRSNDSIARSPSKPAGNSGDPLAELARLIGQNDPFAEFGRTQPAAPQPPAPPAAPPLPKYDFTPPVAPPPPESNAFAPANFARTPFGTAPHSDDGLYHVEGDAQAFTPGAQDGGYLNDGYQQEHSQHPPETYDDYDDVAPKRSRMGITLVAGIIGLAVIGSAGAFGYRAIFGKSGSSAPPPVIKADTTPSKIVPASTRDGATTKVADRVGGDGERLVSREESPVDIKDRAAAAAFPPLVEQTNASVPAQGSGVVTPDPKRVRTIAIHPDGAVVADATPTSAPPPQAAPPAPAAPLPRVTVTQPAAPARAAAPQPPVQQAPPPQRMAATPPADPDPDPDAAPPARKPAAAARMSPAVAQHQAAAPSNAPMSLSPDAASARPTPVPRAQAPIRSAPAPAADAVASAASGAGGYAVQVSSQRSEAEAQAAFRSLQGKYPEQLGSRQAVVHKVDLGAKGIFYRAMVPAGTGSEASELCSSLKAAGGSCLIQRN